MPDFNEICLVGVEFYVGNTVTNALYESFFFWNLKIIMGYSH